MLAWDGHGAEILVLIDVSVSVSVTSASVQDI